ncbi:MAG: hypothetical protein LCH82_04050 [Actinobacteria bacterium]|nr:hypothetical protein [Actinomycetota bacterium]
MSCSSTGSPTPTPVVNATLIGGRLPMPLSSSGVVLLAHADESAFEDVVRAGWPQPTHALPDARALRDLLATVRRRGYAALDGHIHPDSRGVAVPVLGPLGSVYAALSVVVPNDDAPVQRVVEVLKVAAAGIGRELRRRSARRRRRRRRLAAAADQHLPSDTRLLREHRWRLTTGRSRAAGGGDGWFRMPSGRRAQPAPGPRPRAAGRL